MRVAVVLQTLVTMARDIVNLTLSVLMDLSVELIIVREINIKKETTVVNQVAALINIVGRASIHVMEKKNAAVVENHVMMDMESVNGSLIVQKTLFVESITVTENNMKQQIAVANIHVMEWNTAVIVITHVPMEMEFVGLIQIVS